MAVTTEARAQILLIARKRMSVFLSSPCKIKAHPSVAVESRLTLVRQPNLGLVYVYANFES